MQNAVFKHYKKDIPVVYQFTNREKSLHLNTKAVEWLQKQINGNTRTKREMQFIVIFFSVVKYRFRICYFN
jgi:nicotinic acid phosphoribosyltransferase